VGSVAGCPGADRADAPGGCRRSSGGHINQKRKREQSLTRNRPANTPGQSAHPQWDCTNKRTCVFYNTGYDAMHIDEGACDADAYHSALRSGVPSSQ
jgi:hypothetical protein